jgi:two-component system phosphate regulon response regulator PhoB
METILIVDDEKRIRNVFGKMLCRAGYNILKAENAEEAHAFLMRNNVDLVLLDINMPDVGGPAVYGMIGEFFSKTRVIVASVYPLEDQQRLIPGATDYHDKSDSIKVLIEKVQAALLEVRNDARNDTRKNTIEACEERKQA